MSGRGMTAFIGLVTVAMGVIGLSYPLHVMEWVGFAPLMTKPNAGTVEARAVYGGLFVVLGIFTLWAAIDPPAHRRDLLLGESRRGPTVRVDAVAGVGEQHGTQATARPQVCRVTIGSSRRAAARAR